MTEGRCPSCGAPVTFTAGSARVVVCGLCQTVVAREGAHLSAHGRVAALVDTDTPLRLGLEGRHGGAPFRLVGHLQKDHGAGPWDEWYVEFDDGRTAWLSESEGALHLLFPAGQEEGVRLSALQPGERLFLRGQRFTVEEVRSARLVAAAGQLPADVSGGAVGRHVDATGAHGQFLTLDFGAREEAPEAFVGRRVLPEELGLPVEAPAPRRRPVKLLEARCTRCNGPLELKAPDRTRRVACPFCGALLDVSEGKLAFLQALEPPPHPPRIPLGARGTLDGTPWTCIGFLVRSCRVEAVRFGWEEYLLYHPRRGFSFLMASDGHWTHLVPVAAGDVTVHRGSSAHFQGRRYAPFQSVTAVTETVVGEFYWEVRAGETAEATEYVAPPHSLNEDRTPEEVTYTHGTYLAPSQVQEAFGLEEPLPSPLGIAPGQPNPHRERAARSLRWVGLYAGLALLLFLGVSAARPRRVVHEEAVAVPAEARSGTPEAMHFSAPFEVAGRGNLRAEVSAPLAGDDWLGVQGDLVHEETGEVVSFYEELTRDEDVASAEARASGVLARVPPGRYVLRTTPFFPKAQERGYTVRLVSAGPRFVWLLVLWGLLLLGPVLGRLRAGTFETQRWANSNLWGHG
jgi:Domain of unknown function (DUF4178)